MGTAVRAAPKELNLVSFQSKAGGALDGRQYFRRQAGTHLYHTATLGARDMMVMRVGTADPVAVAAVGESYAIHQPSLYQHLDRPENGSASKLRIGLP